MLIEDQVCSLYLARRLKELEVNQNSYFKWEERENGYSEIYHSKPVSCTYKYYSAFTASELLSILPNRITLKEGEPFNSFRIRIEKSLIAKDINDPSKICMSELYIINYYCDTYWIDDKSFSPEKTLTRNISDENSANAFAMALIYLIEHKILEIKS